jgi:hypothetical protein
MPILLAAITLAVRLISPHSLFPALANLPVVPALTGLMGLAALVGAFRRSVSLRPPLYILLQWLILVWIAITLLMNGAGGKDLAGIKFVNDLVFATIVALLVDRLPRFKLLLGSYLFALVFIAVFGIPQTWSPRTCGEVLGPGELLWDERPCSSDRQCEEKPPPRPGAPARRFFRCERHGPFDIPAFQGRMRWVSVFTDSNALGSMCATLIPFLIGWAWTFKRRRLLKWLLVSGTLLLLGGTIIATGSRGSLLGLLLGLAYTMWRFLGRKALVMGGVLAAALAIQMTIADRSLVKRGDENELTGMESSNKWRTAAMDVGMRLWGQYPIFGIGHNRIERYHVLEAHNGFISAASEIGTPGLFLFVLSLWLNFRAVVAARAQALRSKLDDLLRVSTGGMGGLIGGTFAFTVFLSNYATLNTLTLCLLAGGLFRSVQREVPDLRLRLSYWDLIGVAVATALLMGVIHLALSTYFTLTGFPFEFDTSSGRVGAD